jgi:outer membrane protein
MTYNQQRGAEEELSRKQQNLELYQQSLSQEIMVDQNNLSKELYERITTFLQEYGKTRSLQLVLKFDTSSDVLYAGDSLDITQVVIDGLNSKFKDEKTGVKSDTTKTKK